MQVVGIIPQLRTTDLAKSIWFYTTQLGFTLEFQYEDFYAGSVRRTRSPAWPPRRPATSY